MAGNLKEAQRYLNEVKQPDLLELKDRIQRNIDRGPMDSASGVEEEAAITTKEREAVNDPARDRVGK